MRKNNNYKNNLGASRRSVTRIPLRLYDPFSIEPYVISLLGEYADAPGKYHRLKAMRELQKIFGVYFSQSPKLPILAVLYGQMLLNLLIQAVQKAFGDRCCVQNSASMRVLASPNMHGIVRFARLRLIMNQVTSRLSERQLHGILRLNQADRINTDFQQPLEYYRSKAAVMLVSDGIPRDLPYSADIEPNLFAIRFLSPEISTAQLMSLRRIILSNREIEKLVQWMREGFTEFQNQDLSRDFMIILNHRRRLRDEGLYRFFHKYIKKVPGNNLLASEFLQGLHIFLLENGFDQLYEKDEVTSFLGKQGHRKITIHPRGKPNFFKYADLDFTDKFKAQYMERKSLKGLVDKRFDHLSDAELI